MRFFSSVQLFRIYRTDHHVYVYIYSIDITQILQRIAFI